MKPTPFDGLLNAEVRCAERRRELAAAQQPKPEPQPTADQVLEWTLALKAEPLDRRVRREELARFFLNYDRYRFPVAGQWILGAACASRLRLGAPYADFYKIQSSGELRERRRQ